MVNQTPDTSQNSMETILYEKTKNSNGYFWGVFSDTRRFFIADKNFQVLFETPAFSPLDGNFTREVKEALEEFKINQQFSNMRTEANIEELKASIELENRLWKLHNDRTKKLK